MKAGTQKQVIVKQGPYAGKEAILIGRDIDVLGHSIIGGNDKIAIDYIKRLSMEPVSVQTKIYMATIDGKDVALNEYEISGKVKK